jgi:hypothetical protein
LADGSWSDRRQRLPWEIFAELMRRVLRPRATAAQADAFWRGWRLLLSKSNQFMPFVRRTPRRVRIRPACHSPAALRGDAR